MKTQSCPRCGRTLAACGEAWVESDDAAALPVFQCESCRVAVDLFGESMPALLTFYVTPDGRRFDAHTGLERPDESRAS